MTTPSRGLARAVENEIDTWAALDDARALVLRRYSELADAVSDLRRVAEAHRAAVADLAHAQLTEEARA